MKPQTPMKHSVVFRPATLALTALLLAAPLGNLARADDDIAVQHAGAISFASGGVGQESLDQLSAMSRDFNLKLVFALNSGAYLSDVPVTITDTAGKTVVDAQSNGPWFLAKLPAGAYRVTATVADKAEQRRVTVGASQLKTVDFRWASE